MIILEAFPGYTFEDLDDLSREDWSFMYAKARTMLKHIRRDPVLDERGHHLITPAGDTVTIDKYPHIEHYMLFGEDPPVHEKVEPEPTPLSYKVDPVTGNPIPVNPNELPGPDEEMFSGVTFDPGMSDKSSR